MKDFYELDDWQQCELLFELIERIGANDVRSLEELSEKEGKAPLCHLDGDAERAGSSYAAFPSAY
ncbi:MAG: hypothetical protein WB662_10865 [Methyloceanibacter sp.]|jgi:hypothetical protein